VDLVPRETQESKAPASSITKLGFVRFSLPLDPALVGDARRIRIVELPSFSIEESERPRVQMQPLSGRRRAWKANGGGGEQAANSASNSQRVRTSTLVGVEPFPVRSRGSSPSIAIAACEAAASHEERAPAAASPGASLAASPAARDGTPTEVDLAPLGRDGTPTDVDLAPIEHAPAPVADEPAPEREPEPALDPLVLLQRLRQLSPPLASQAERAALRRLRRLTRPRASGSSMFDTLEPGAEIVVGMRPARARWRVAIIGAAMGVAGAAAGLAALL
jgi:hypothetical protein